MPKQTITYSKEDIILLVSDDLLLRQKMVNRDECEIEIKITPLQGEDFSLAVIAHFKKED